MIANFLEEEQRMDYICKLMQRNSLDSLETQKTPYKSKITTKESIIELDFENIV